MRIDTRCCALRYEMTRIKIDKTLSNGRSATYALYINEDGGENICSIEISSGEEISRVSDICRDTVSARKFLQTLADEEVEPCHLYDIVCDSLPL